MLSVWHAWVIAAIILFIVEVFTPGFVLASFGIGCLFSAVAAMLDLSLKMQIVGFIAGTLISFFGVRPFFNRYCYGGSREIRTNVDALVGKTGRVTERVDIEKGSGRVLVGGDDWRAISIDGGTIDDGVIVEVVRVEGSKVYVKRTQVS